VIFELTRTFLAQHIHCHHHRFHENDGDDNVYAELEKFLLIQKSQVSQQTTGLNHFWFKLFCFLISLSSIRGMSRLIFIELKCETLELGVIKVV